MGWGGWGSVLTWGVGAADESFAALTGIANDFGDVTVPEANPAPADSSAPASTLSWRVLLLSVSAALAAL
eukprot:417568-Rhodomonas_salina.2